MIVAHLSLSLRRSAGLSQSEQWCQECVCCNLWQCSDCVCVWCNFRVQSSVGQSHLFTMLWGHLHFPRWPGLFALCWSKYQQVVKLGEEIMPTRVCKYLIEWGLSVDWGFVHSGILASNGHSHTTFSGRILKPRDSQLKTMTFLNKEYVKCSLIVWLYLLE